jgi:hypothetical protein
MIYCLGCSPNIVIRIIKKKLEKIDLMHYKGCKLNEEHIIIISFMQNIR